MLDKNVLSVAHHSDPQYVKLIWYYSIVDDIFEKHDVEVASRHALSKSKFRGSDHEKVAKGRVVLYGGEYYLFIWTPGYHRYTKDIAERIKAKVEQDFPVDYVVDEVCDELL